jgi:hypothetical protein
VLSIAHSWKCIHHSSSKSRHRRKGNAHHEMGCCQFFVQQIPARQRGSDRSTGSQSTALRERRRSQICGVFVSARKIQKVALIFQSLTFTLCCVCARQPRVLRKQNSVFCVCARREREMLYKAGWTLDLVAGHKSCIFCAAGGD